MIELKNVTKTYNKGKKNEYTALRGVDLKIEDGEFIAITGTSGAGKSTLLYVLSGIDTYEGGSCMLDGVELNTLGDVKLSKIRNKTIGFVMQDFALVEDFSVLENVMLPLQFTKMSGKKKKELVKEAIKKVDIEELTNKQVNQLSGGQKQRTAIARAIVNSPNYIFADEPTGALDSNTSREIMNLFEKLNEAGQTILIVTHDPEVAGRCKRRIQIEDGKIV
ncbi:MAG: ABC transporter ATP-binding protein [Lachnospiraceae bacterium]|nr:ABC transporter ATP-binding protein [Lachnospiraceae bacterium]